MFFTLSDDLCEGGELFSYLVGDDGVKKFDEPLARYFFRQLAAGVAHMHAHKLFHRDIKLENIVLDATYHAKLMDFGLAKRGSDCVCVNPPLPHSLPPGRPCSPSRAPHPIGIHPGGHRLAN
jgi:serine/threonine protein kinase